MVPLVCLTVLLPLAAAGGHDMMEMMNMMNMMNQMQQSKGWHAAPVQQKSQDWWGMQSQADYEAYLKWCEENKIREQEFTKQKELLDMYEKSKEAKRLEMEKARMHKEAEERQANMMSQWKKWQMQLEMQGQFDGLYEKMVELNHHYMYMVVCEFLRFCKCSDFSDDLERYFQHDGGAAYAHHEWDLDDLNAVDRGLSAVDVAKALANKPEVDQVKAFFGGLKDSMCEGARQYVEQLQQWEKQYNFYEKLM